VALGIGVTMSIKHTQTMIRILRFLNNRINVKKIIWSIRSYTNLIASISLILLIVLTIVTITKIHHNLVLIIILPILLYLIFANYFFLHPIEIPIPPEKEEPGKPVLKDNKSDLLLIISLKRIRFAASKQDFYKNDWSYAWLNTIEKEVGSYAVCDSSNLTEDNVLSKRVIIISKSAIDGIAHTHMNLMNRFLQKGGLLVLDQPTPAWSNVSGLDVKDTMIKPTEITYVDSVLLRESDNNNLTKTPLNTDLVITHPLGEHVKILMEMDNKPAISGNILKKGYVISILFNYGLQLISLRQGKPSNPNYEIKTKFENKKNITTTDLILSNATLSNDCPFADLLERALFYVIENYQPLPRWWYYPSCYRGAFIMSHDEDYFGDKSTYMASYENKINSKSTFFVIPDSDISQKALKKLLNNNTTIGIHWNRFSRPYKKFLNITLSQKKISLSEQIELLKKKVPEKYSIISSRIHFLKWDEHYTRTFRILNCCGIKIDSSYGSSGGMMSKGYLFGTGFPFYPIDTNGAPINVLEMPIELQDDYGGADISFIQNLMKDSHDKYHTTLVFLYHPFQTAINEKIKNTWIQTYKIAKDHELWITTFEEYYKFYENRKRSTIWSVFKNNMLDIFIDAMGYNQTIWIPYTWNLKNISTVKIDKAFAKYVLFQSMGHEFCLINVRKGVHEIKVKYKN
jgi:hypothetical protein